MTDGAFLEELERRAVRYFWETAPPATGLVPDRARADGSAPGEMASVAATGFGLTALALGANHGWLQHRAAAERAETTLRFLLRSAPHERGFLYHFLDTRTGERRWNCEASTIDTALAIFGALSAGACFGGTVAELAHELWARADWRWITDAAGRIRHGAKPADEGGFLACTWDQFSEHWGMTCLALASPSSPLPASAWAAWRRTPWVDYGGERFLHHPPLFVHQFPQAWLDWRGYQDPVSGVDFFANAAAATRAQRRFCLDLRERFPGYSETLWGLTSSDADGGYFDWGGPPVGNSIIDPRIDGTVVPCAVAGSLPFEPGLCLAALRDMHGRFGDTIFGPYGFADAFHPLNGWVARDVIGIDQGITLLMAENLRTGLVWDWLRSVVPLPPRGL